MDDGTILLKRDCDAIRIPSGEKISLKEGQEVAVTQSLGGSHTLMTSMGLARLDDKDADAIGLKPGTEGAAETNADATDKPLTEEELKQEVWERLKTVFDPEIPVNIVDLGLVYSMELSEEGKKVEVDMTLTAPGCGMGPTIQADAKSKVEAIGQIEEADVRLVWEPAWNQDMITEHGKMKLGLI
ncbi:MAG: putative Fe-S cluster assembly protein SufT [Verrucomicrobiota bacterium]